MRSVTWRLLLAVACAAVAAHGSRAQDRETPRQPDRPAQARDESPRQRIDALVKQLSHDDWRQRDRAQEELAKFGEAARIRLQAMLEKTRDPDLAARIEGILKLIEENRLTGPTLVSLKLKDATPAAAFEALSRESAIRMEFEPADLLERPDLPKVTVDADRQPFWAVVREICVGAKVRPLRSGGATLTLAADDVGWAARPYVISGLFLVTAAEAQSSHVRRFGVRDNEGAAGAAPAPAVAAAEGTLQVQFDALFEPKVQPMSWSIPAVQEATDDTGRSLVPKRGGAGQRRTFYNAGGRAGDYEISLALESPPPGTARRLTRLKAVAHFSVITRTETLQVDNILTAGGVTRTIGPAKVTVQGLNKAGEEAYELSVTSEPAGDVAAWRAMQPAYQRRPPRLYDSQGRELASRGGSGSYGMSEIRLTTRFVRQARIGPINNRPAGEPAKLLWEIPLAVKEFQVPLEFKDLPLP